MVGQELDAGRLATGLDRRPAGDLGEERRDVSRGIGAHEVLGELEQRDDRAVPLARRLAVGDAVAPDAELALERRRQPLDERASLATRPSASATRTARRTSGRAKNRSPRTWNGMPGRAHRALDGGQLGVRPDEDGDRAVRGPGRGQRPDRGRRSRPAPPPRSAKPADLGRGSRRTARDEPLRRPRRGARLTLVGCRPGPRRGRGSRGPGPPASSGSSSRADDPRGRVARAEPDQVVARRPRERVDRLVLVADDGKVVPPAEPRVEQRRLERVRVLELVDREPAYRSRTSTAIDSSPSMSPIVRSSMSSKSIRPARALAVS